MAVLPVERLRDEIGRLLHRGLDVRQFSLAAARVLRRAVPCDGVCLVTMDPATALPTGEVVEGGLPAAATARLAEIEVRETDFIKFSALSRSARPVASLHEATGGDLGRSRRHRELKQPHGFGDELRAALVGNAGVWGGLTLLRPEGRRPFSPADTRRVAAVAPLLAEGLQRSVVVAAFTDGGRPSGDDQHGQHGQHGLLLLADDDTIELADATARMWLDELRTGDGTGERLPPVVNGVASQARAAVAGRGAASMAGARVRTPSGRWLSVRGSVLGEGAEARIAVILEPARSPELAPLIADAYGLTDRERAVTGLVARGHSTNEIAGRLHLSPYTVQDHLKAIFGKVGVGTRGELVAHLFFDHYAPRLTSGTPLAPTGWFTD